MELRVLFNGFSNGVRFLAHESRAFANSYNFFIVIDGGVLKFNNACIGPRFALAFGQDGRYHMQGVASKNGFGKPYIRHAQVANRGAHGGVVHAYTDHQTKGE